MYANFGQVNMQWNPAGQEVTEAIKQMGLPEPGDKPARPSTDKTQLVTSEGATVEDVGGEAMVLDTTPNDAVESKAAGVDLSTVRATVPWYKNKWTWIGATVVVAGGVAIWYAKKHAGY